MTDEERKDIAKWFLNLEPREYALINTIYHLLAQQIPPWWNPEHDKRDYYQAVKEAIVTFFYMLRTQPDSTKMIEQFIRKEPICNP